MGRKSNYSLSFKESVVHDYLDNNMKNKDVIKKYGITHNAIWKWCIELGRKELVPFGNTHILKIKTACNFSYDNIIDYAIDNSLKFDDIVVEFELNEIESQHLNVVIKTRNKRNELNIPTKVLKFYGHKDEIISDIKSGISFKDLMTKYGFNTGYIYTFLNNLESEYPELQKYIDKLVRHKNKYGKICKTDQYIVDHCSEMTIFDICNELGIKYQTVKSKAYRLKKLGYDVEFKSLKSK